MDRFACQGTLPRLVCLGNMTWHHRRAFDPLIETLPSFRAQHAGIDVEWTSRPLAYAVFAAGVKTQCAFARRHEQRR